MKKDKKNSSENNEEKPIISENSEKEAKTEYGLVKPQEIVEEMSRCYLDYAMSVMFRAPCRMFETD
jgi:DNA gyrase/topoisomerase IV subunit A